MVSAQTFNSAGGEPVDYRINNMRCEKFAEPVGVDVRQPRLSWTADSDVRGQKQTACQILVASASDRLTDAKADMWNSGKVESEESLDILYDGAALASHTTYYWKVRCWDKDGRPSKWSDPATWTTGLLDPAEWKAQWIGTDWEAGQGLPLFRRQFNLAKPVRKALVSVCGLGHYKLFLNGRQVGDRFLNPARSNYDKTVYYTTYEITGRLDRGDNVFGVMLGKGFYNTQGDRRRRRVHTANPLMLILQARVEYADGTGETIISDARWKTAPGPILHSSLLGGTDYDARRMPGGWRETGFADQKWENAVVRPGPGGRLRASETPPMRVFDRLAAVSVDELEAGIFVYDFGQNASAKPRLRIRGEAGQTVTLYPAEYRQGHTGNANNGKGRVDQASVQAPTYWQYTLAGDNDVETWSPGFTYSGYQYIEAHGAVPAGHANPRGLPVIEELQSLHVRNASRSASEFSCSEPLFNDIRRFIDWSMRSNMGNVLTDCPHREKLGWLEQTYLMGPAISYNYDIEAFYAKITRDIREAQGEDGIIYTIAPLFSSWTGINVHKPGPNKFRYSPEWGAAGVLVPWLLYQRYGDRQALGNNFAAMTGFVDYLRESGRGLVPRGVLGDWFDFGHGRGRGPSRFTSKELTAMAIFYHCTDVSSRTAAILGHSETAGRYRELAGQIKEAFNKRFFNGTDEYENNGSCQTANGMAVALGLVPETRKQAVVRKIVDDLKQRDYQQTSGDVGFRYLLQALAENGYSDIIARMARRESPGSYGFIVRQGWTTMPETWDVELSASLNHLMLGHIQQWFWESLAGIRPNLDEAAGFKKIIIAPRIEGAVQGAEGEYGSPYGTIRSAWEKTDENFKIDIRIPVNTSAEIHLPAGSIDAVQEGGIPLSDADDVEVTECRNGRLSLLVGAGEYAFQVSVMVQ